MITCYEGRQGSGKTACAVLDAVRECLRMGKKRGKVWNLYTNMESLNIRAIKKSYKSNLPIKVNYIDSFEDLMFVVDGVVLLDEGHIWFFNRKWSGFPTELLFFWSQARKRGLHVVYTVQDFDRMDIIVRQLTDEVIRLSKFGAFSLKYIRDMSGKRDWHFRGFRYVKRAWGWYDHREILFPPEEAWDSQKSRTLYIEKMKEVLGQNGRKIEREKKAI